MRCPHCRIGVRIADTYSLQGVTRDSSYCGFCGRSFPGLNVEEAEAEIAVRPPVKTTVKPMVKLSESAPMRPAEILARLRPKPPEPRDHAREAAADRDE